MSNWVIHSWFAIQSYRRGNARTSGQITSNLLLHNLQLPFITSSLLMYNLQFPHGCHCHHGLMVVIFIIVAMIIMVMEAGLHNLWYPGIRDTSTWNKFGAHGEHRDVFLFSNLGALWFSENLIRYSLHVCLREVKNNLFSFKHSYLRHFSWRF